MPVLPPVFDLKPIKKTEDRLKLLKRLLKRSDITTVINACDAGREGELIFRYIIQASKCKKTIKTPVVAVNDPGGYQRSV